MMATKMAANTSLKRKLGTSTQAENQKAITDLEQQFHRLEPEFVSIINDWLRELQRAMKDPDNVDVGQVYDQCHEMRGLAGSFGQKELSDLAHSLCLYLHALDGHEHADLKLLQAHVNTMTLISDASEGDEQTLQTMIDALKFAVQKLLAS